MVRPRRTVGSVAAVLCWLAVAGPIPASAAETIWAKHQIFVENHSDYGPEVAEAIQQYNLLPGARVKFRRPAGAPTSSSPR